MTLDIPRHLSFNPRSREGSDLLGDRVIVPIQVSIHAPVKGATRRAGTPAMA